MRSILLLLLAAIAVPAVCAQRILLADQNCPVGISATRQAAGSTIFTGAAPRDPASQGVHVTLTPRDRNIASAEIIVHALTFRTRALPVGPNTPDTIEKNFTLQAVNGHPTFSSDVWMSRTSGIQSIELVSLTYADGATWRAASNTPCRIEPSPVVLVADK